MNLSPTHAMQADDLDALEMTQARRDKVARELALQYAPTVYAMAFMCTDPATVSALRSLASQLEDADGEADIAALDRWRGARMIDCGEYHDTLYDEVFCPIFQRIDAI